MGTYVQGLPAPSSKLNLDAVQSRSTWEVDIARRQRGTRGYDPSPKLYLQRNKEVLRIPNEFHLANPASTGLNKMHYRRAYLLSAGYQGPGLMCFEMSDWTARRQRSKFVWQLWVSGKLCNSRYHTHTHNP